MSPATAMRLPIATMESGPVGGIIAGAEVMRDIGISNVIAFDMGGTTAKAGVIYKGQALTNSIALIGGYERALPVQISMIDIFEVGTGGGSIAWLDEGMALHVGPRSAGAEPGPACYGRGGEQPTVTDANLVLGRLAPDRFLGGSMKLDVQAARAAIASKIAEPLGLDVIQAAKGILRIAATAMSWAVKTVTTERGLDAASFPLIAYGGAGPLHAAEIARFERHEQRIADR
jgi:N-methylhydantoinase A